MTKEFSWIIQIGIWFHVDDNDGFNDRFLFYFFDAASATAINCAIMNQFDNSFDFHDDCCCDLKARL